jgi:hypothetical protein
MRAAATAPTSTAIIMMRTIIRKFHVLGVLIVRSDDSPRVGTSDRAFDVALTDQNDQQQHEQHCSEAVHSRSPCTMDQDDRK